MAWKLKQLQNGNFEVRDGKPVFVNDEDGSDFALDVTEHFNGMHTLREENKSVRMKLESTKTALKQFEGISIEDVQKNAEAAKALENIEAMKKGELDKLSKTFQANHEEEVKRITNAASAREKELLEEVRVRDEKFNSIKLENAFANSQFLRERAGSPVSLIRAYFAQNFRIDENGDIYGVNDKGERILSKRKVTESAPFEEAIQILCESHPDRDKILAPEEKPGGGMNPGGRFSGPEANKMAAVLNRMNDPKMSPQQKMELLTANGLWGFGGNAGPK